jgi:hypothetical protein
MPPLPGRVGRGKQEGVSYLLLASKRMGLGFPMGLGTTKKWWCWVLGVGRGGIKTDTYVVGSWEGRNQNRYICCCVLGWVNHAWGQGEPAPTLSLPSPWLGEFVSSLSRVIFNLGNDKLGLTQILILS